MLNIHWYVSLTLLIQINYKGAAFAATVLIDANQYAFQTMNFYGDIGHDVHARGLKDKADKLYTKHAIDYIDTLSRITKICNIIEKNPTHLIDCYDDLVNHLANACLIGISDTDQSIIYTELYTK